MSENLLSQGQTFDVNSGGVGTVREFIGAGGQGGVYAAEIAGRPIALKWYHPHVVGADRTLRSRIARMVSQPPPAPNFLWPISVAEIKGSQSFGYIMPLMSGDRRPLKDLLAAPPKRLDLALDVRAAACFDIATSFQRLHAIGYCYQDINFGGFFIDPERGTIQICDADNIAVDGEPGGVYGTRKFMAPEVVLRNALPSTRTDLYSMAVLFFYLLFNWHPLDGKREASLPVIDHSAEQKLYGVEPKFIFDPSDPSNGPVQGNHDWLVARWTAMTQAIRLLFTRAFTAGLRADGDRPLEGEWRVALAQLMGAVFRCGACGFEHAHDLYRARDEKMNCVACKAGVTTPPVLTLSRDIVLLTPRRLILDYQIAAQALGDGAPVATTESHPKDPAILGLRNLGQENWRIAARDGAEAAVASGKTARLSDGLLINFGPRKGAVSGVETARAKAGGSA